MRQGKPKTLWRGFAMNWILGGLAGRNWQSHSGEWRSQGTQKARGLADPGFHKFLRLFFYWAGTTLLPLPWLPAIQPFWLAVLNKSMPVGPPISSNPLFN